MAEKKDIGKYFEEKLKNGTKSPNQTVWHKITRSLDELPEQKNSKRPYWLMVLGIPILLGFYLWSHVSSEEKKNLQTIETNQSEEYLTIPSKIGINDEDYLTTTLIDSLEYDKSIKEKEVSDLNLYSGNEEDLITKPSAVIVKKKNDINHKKSPAKTSDIDENFTITKKYHYYNSENEEEWTTTSKTKIDSLLTQPKKGIDSKVLKSSDSLVE